MWKKKRVCKFAIDQYNILRGGNFVDINYIVSTAISVILIANVVLACFVVFFERRKPASTWAWLLVLYFIPVFGFVCYLIFGRDSKKERVFEEKGNYDHKTYFQYLLKSEKYEHILESQIAALSNKEDITGFPYLNDLVMLHLNSGNWMTTNNKVESFTDGSSKFRSLIEDIRQAREYIHMEYYIFRGDNLGRTLVQELAQKAEEGVEVKLLYDGMGNNMLPAHFFDPLKKAGGHAEAFLPPFIVRLNYRDHRKICVIDGKIGYIGGFNVGDEYLGLVKRYGPWRDTHLRIQGDAVDQIQLRFIMDWNFVSKHQVPMDSRYFPDKDQGDHVKMQIVSSGPDTSWKNIRNGYFKMINEAEKNVYIETPYFVPDDSILEALKVAALSGIDVRIIFPAHPDHFFVYWANMSYLGELLEVGVKCYKYENGFIHSKMVCIDGCVTSIGSANMDIRSFAVNFEVNAFIYDREQTEKFERDFMEDIAQSTEVTMDWYEARSPWFKIKEAVSRLISPIL